MKITKFFYTTGFILILFANAYSQGGTWTWIHGDTSTYSSGNYGTKGVASPTNYPGHRYQAAYWTDLQGNFWIFGGEPYADMWKYDPNTNIWTWMSGSKTTYNTGNYGTKGVPSVNNFPSYRGLGANCWTDSSGNLWLFGGANQNIRMNDLWKFNPTTLEWTWVNGSNPNIKPNDTPVFGVKNIANSTNNPGARDECKSGWVDGDNLYLYGGGTSKFASDMWEYSISNDRWTWIGGSDTFTLGVYGTQGVANGANLPHSRYCYTKWKKGKKLYIFGGGVPALDTAYNDVWQFDLTTQLWTWVSGKNYPNDVKGGVPFGNCISSVLNLPSARVENQTIQNSDCSNSFWTFGGLDKSGNNSLNDLWLYKIDSNIWIRVTGDTTLNDLGKYGTRGIASTLNRVPARGGMSMWSDKQNRLYIFGGRANNRYFGDLWRFDPDPYCLRYNLTTSFISYPSVQNLCKNTVTTISISSLADSVKLIPILNVTYNNDSTLITIKPLVTSSYKIIAYGLICNKINDTLDVTFNVKTYDTFNVLQYLCAGTSYFFNSQSLTVPGIYWDTLANASGCDSIIRLSLIGATASSKFITDSFCSGNSYFFKNQYQTAAGQYKDTLTNTFGCDSFVFLDLRKNNKDTVYITDSICYGDSIYFNGFYRKIPGIYADTLQNQKKCDSHIFLTLFVFPAPSIFSQYYVECNSKVFRNKVYLQNDSVIDVFRNRKNCDSFILKYYIQIKPQPQQLPPDTIKFCNFALFNNSKYLNSETIVSKIKTKDVLECDSLIQLIQLVKVPYSTIKISVTPQKDIYRKGEQVELKANPPSHRIWSMKDTSRSILVNLIDDSMAFYVIGWIDTTCLDTAYIVLKTDDIVMAEIPTAFTPNGDGINDILSCRTTGISKLQNFEIFNRLGQLVFKTENLQEGWDGYYKGILQNSDTYFFVMKATSFKGKLVTREGSFLLLR